MAAARWTSYDASFPAQMGGGDEKALPSRRQTSTAVKRKGREAPRAALRRSSSRIGQIEVARLARELNEVGSGPLGGSHSSIRKLRVE
jgi:hypothetical protein